MRSEELDWTLMQSFLSVVDSGSLLKASEALGTTQSTISRHIVQLEAQLKVPLFERTGRRLAPTVAAQALAGHARRMSEAANDAIRAIRGANQSLSMTVRITASQLVAHHLLPPILVELSNELPNIDIELVASNDVVNLLQREADIAIRMIRPDQGSIIAKKVGDVALGSFTSAAYAARRGVPAGLDDMKGFDLIGFNDDDTLIKAFRALGVEIRREDFRLRTDDHALAVRMVQAGLGIGFMSRFVAASVGGLVPVIPTAPVPAMPMWLAVHREIKGSNAIRAVYDFLGDALTAALSRSKPE